ncbi:mechanosensitive ion channel domain-containing protein [Candidatus Omnitrophota bacterium]
MKREPLKNMIRSLILFVILYTGVFSGVAISQTNVNNTKVDGAVDKLEETTQEIKEVEKAKEKAEEVKAEAATSKKEAEIHQKAVEIERKKAGIKIKEAETARDEAEAIKKTAKTKEEIREAVETAKQKKNEAEVALKKVNIAEEKMLAAQEKARITEEELALALERAVIAEAKIRERNLILYKKLSHSAAVLLLGYLLILMLVRIINRRIEDIKIKHYIRKNVIYVITALMVIYITLIWVQNVGSVTIFFSALGAGLVIVLQEPILCIAGWLIILVQRPFEIGDRIEFGGVKGDIIDIRLFQTSLLEIQNWVEADQSTGRIVNVPNSAVFKKESYNYSRGFEFLWNEIKIIVTFESDWKRAREIMLTHATKLSEGMEEIVKKRITHMAKQYMIHYEKFSPIVYVDIKDSGAELSLRYLTEARKRRVTQDALCQAILDDFEKEEKVNFAYTTYRIVK